VELLATLLTDLPLDERRFHGLLHDLASMGAVGTITPSGLRAGHSFGEGQRENCRESIEVSVLAKSCIGAQILEQLHSVGFRPMHALEFRAQEGAAIQAQWWPLLCAYVDELQGWVFTTELDFEETLARAATQAGIYSIPIAGDGQRKAVLISATTMKQLAP
jgi:hypothetical protein